MRNHLNPLRRVTHSDVRGEVVAVRRRDDLITHLGVEWADGTLALLHAEIAIHWVRTGQRNFWCKLIPHYARIFDVEIADVRPVWSDRRIFELCTPYLTPLNGLDWLPDCDESWDQHLHIPGY